jgi:hypothetical protein
LASAKNYVKDSFPRYETTEQQSSLLAKCSGIILKSFINNLKKMLTAEIWQKLTKLLLNISIDALNCFGRKKQMKSNVAKNMVK